MAVTLSGGRPPSKKQQKSTRQSEDIFAEFRDDAPESAPDPAPVAAGQASKEASWAQKVLSGIIGIPAFLSFASIFILGIFGQGFLEDRGLEWLMIAMFGVTFFLFGLLVLVSARTPFGLIFVAIGGCVAGFAVSYGLGSPELQEKLMSSVVPMAAIAVFPLSGLGVMIGGLVQRSNRRKKYTLEVRAEIVDKKKVRSRHHDSHGYHTMTTYPLTWKYSVNGKEYAWRSNMSRKPEPRGIGDSGRLLLNPDNPRDAYDPAVGNGMALFLVIFGAIFVFVGVFSMYCVLAQ